MIIVNCTQGSAEWLQARAGVITASMFSTARSKVNGLTSQQQTYVNAMLNGHSEARSRELAGYKAAPRAEVVLRALDGEKVGEPSNAALSYAFELAVERIGGLPLDGGFETWQMRRGHELEPEARMEHEIQTGLIVTQVGLVKTDDGVFGASADGFIGEDGGSEYKCFLAPDKLRSFHIDNDASEVLDQVQAHAFSTNPKAGKRTFSVKSEQIGTEDIAEVAKAAQDSENTPEGFRLFSIRNIDTGHEVKP